MASPEELLRKKELFDQLDRLLDDDDDEEPDLGRLASEAALRKPISPSPRLPRSVSHITQIAQISSSIDAALPPAVPLPNNTLQKIKTASLRKTTSDVTGLASAPNISSAMAGKGSGKRKRDAIKMAPEGQQIFAGLNFFFFPNTEANPARRMKITKAREHGTTRIDEWKADHITHVVVDQGLTLTQLLKSLRIESLPDGIILVNENYPAECIAHLTLLDPKWPQFTVKGTEVASTMLAVPNAAPRSLQESPQLKQPPRTLVEKSQETPSEIETHATVASPVILPQIVDEQEFGSANGDITSSEEFDKAIETAKALAHVPLDDDDEGSSRRGSIEGIESGDEGEEAAGLKLLKQRKSKYTHNQEKFQCMQKHTGQKTGSPNLATIEILEQMVKYYTDTRDEWRSRAYRMAISTLRNHPTKITTKEEALRLPRIGGRLAEKIEEIAVTNRLRRLDNAKLEPADVILQTFMGVYGAGRAYATKWVDQGYTTLDELRKNPDLTRNQFIGLEHYEDFQTRIPRAEVAQHGEIVRRALQKIDPQFEVIIGGSYRRGAKDSGDIDCILTRPSTTATYLRSIILEQLVPQLTAKGFLVASLAATDKDDGSKWHGASCLPGAKIWRRIDFLLVPSDELGAALIYFTGNDIFNRSMRLLASTKGMRLNQRGLYKDTMRGPKRVKITEGTLVEGKDEKKIFALLGVPWRPPEHRIC